MGSIPTYVNSGLRKRFRNGTFTWVGNCLYSHTSGGLPQIIKSKLPV